MRKLIVIIVLIFAVNVHAAHDANFDPLKELAMSWEQQLGPAVVAGYEDGERLWTKGAYQEDRMALIRSGKKLAENISEAFRSYRADSSEENKKSLLMKLKMLCSQADQLKEMEGPWASVDFIMSVQSVAWAARYIDERLSEADVIMSCQNSNGDNPRLEMDAP